MATRYRTARLTVLEIEALLAAVSQMTDGNANSYAEWTLQTGGTATEWAALKRGERVLDRAKHGQDRP